MSLTPSATARAMRSRPATFRARASGVRDWIGRCSWSENHRRHTIDVANPMTTPMITEHGNSHHRHPSRRHVRRVSSALMPPCLRRRSAPSTLQRGSLLAGEHQSLSVIEPCPCSRKNTAPKHRSDHLRVRSAPLMGL